MSKRSDFYKSFFPGKSKKDQAVKNYLDKIEAENKRHYRAKKRILAEYHNEIGD